MRHLALFSVKDKSKKLTCRLLQFLFGALRVNSGMDQTGFNLVICISSFRNLKTLY